MRDDDLTALTAYRFSEIRADLAEILVQVRITNGRVTAAEKAIVALQVGYGIGGALLVAGAFWLFGKLP